MALLSIMGLYNDNSFIFDGFRTPENVDWETTVNTILLECAEFELLYPDPIIMKLAIKTWTDKEFPIWKHLQETTEYKYNPIWNKDGTVTIKHESNINYKDVHDGKDTDTTITEQLTEDGNKQTTTGKISAYNETEFQNRDWTETAASGMDGTRKKTDELDYGHTIERKEDADTSWTKDTRTETGNIGVTTTQSMIREEREIAQFNVIDYIVKSFKERFCILVY